MTPIVITVLLLFVAAVSPVAINRKGRNGTEESGTNANVTSTSHLIYGDIMVNTSNDDGILRNAGVCTRFGCKWPKTRKEVIIPYEISNVFTKIQKEYIKKILKDFQEGEYKTCIRFVKKTRCDKHYISFISDIEGCWSYLGRQGYRQYISLNTSHCLYKNVVQHEVLHALGFHHEHVRSDRDSHVIINFENIKPDQKRNFEIANTNNLGTPYDYNSVMHYHKYAYTKNDQPTIIARDPLITSFGTATEMNANDYERVNRLYECCKQHLTLFRLRTMPSDLEVLQKLACDPILES
ncbi:low choriolytic enzyme-like [Festucalex cinctus]